MEETKINNNYMVYVTLTKKQLKDFIKQKADKKYLIAIEVKE